MHELVGKVSIKFALRYLRRRYRRQARIALGLGVLLAAVAAYLASRQVPEG
jgi:predicted transcriptional regulator